ncbi:hypothetical protein Ancab_011872 [Ancistrocladus abbreviatus]
MARAPVIRNFLLLSRDASVTGIGNKRMQSGVAASSAMSQVPPDHHNQKGGDQRAENASSSSSSSSSSRGQKQEIFWMKDPKSGNWIPESHFGEIDVADLRRDKLLTNSGKHIYYQ